jgi:ATP-binding cassette subfamily B protein
MIKTIKYCLIVFKYSWEATGVYAFLSIFSWVYESTFYPLIQVILLAKFIDFLQKFSDISFTQILPLAIFYILATLLRLILKTFSDLKQDYLFTKLDSYLDLKIAQKLTELDPATFEKASFQSLLSQLDGVKQSMQAQLQRFTQLIGSVTRFVTAAIVVSVTFPYFAPLLLIAAIPSYLTMSKARDKMWPYFGEKRSPVVRLSGYVKSLLSMDSTSKESVIYKTGPVLLSKVKQHQTKYDRNFRNAINPHMIKVIIARFINLLAFAYTQYITLSQVFVHLLSVGQFTLIFQQSLTMSLGAEQILSEYSSTAIRTKYLEKFFEFLEVEKVISSPENPVRIPDSPSPAIIEFKNVSFKYPKTDRYILKNFNLTIQPGEKIAIVGENGAGKSTLIKLLMRFYDVTDGEILVNGVNIRNVNLDEWHAKVGALFQDFIKYQFTFKENVYFGNLDENKNEKLLKHAIEQSGAEAFLKDLPERYDQVVGKMFDKGIDLSGGQWQKLALARAFFRNAPFLILDEPTSAIDAKAEYEIFQRVQHLQKDKTVLIISHRFSTVRNADRILVIDEGRIVEEGNHEKLMKKKGLYAELFNIQAQGYK